MNLAELLIKDVGAPILHRKTIVVIGDVVNDVWVYGHTSASQDGCRKFVQDSSCETIGGAGNAARCLSEWAVHVELCGHQINHQGTKTRFVEDGKVVFRYDQDALANSEHDREREQAIEWTRHADGVLLSDYDKGFLTPALIREIADECHRRHVPCVADVKRTPDLYAGCITKANENWYLEHCIASVITRGADCPVVSGRINYRRLPLVNCVNHVGAGDCFAAHLVLALTCGFTLEDAATIAHSAGRVYVQHPHSRPPLPQEIAADLS